MENVKLMCSYGGRIQRRPHDLQLSYINGHTKILTVNRNINFSNFLLKLQDLCEYNLEIQVKYKLPGHDYETLISVFDDDDVDQMMFEYDLLRRGSIKPARFRLFVFFPATVKPVAGGSLNPDFLFGFDKEYSFDYSPEIPETPDTVASLPGNVVVGDGAPTEIAGVWARESYIYPAPLVYRPPAIAGGFFETGLYNLYADCRWK
ncbi:hypothetical protein L2E82_43853 [Cichorium intybus]|uniref:Uncharacterized protein n=1 Tax=Cichorium intybus TaxID=13427 RepID=A0ACB8ZPA8_CICIN|nr:hypothetical protein L2E82_43853 [Cichorium intybus]